jgi:phytoene dehydrogenase-like protein
MSLAWVSRRAFLTLAAMTAASMALDWSKIRVYAAKMGPKKNYPVVVIGAGLGGLCCAAYLARAGIPVTVVEQHSLPGGYASAFDRGRFSFEVSLHGTSIHQSSTARMLENLGVLGKIDLVQLPEVYRLQAPGMDLSVPQQDPQAYVEVLSRYFPDESAGIRSVVNEMVDLSEEVERYIENKGIFLKILFPLRYPRMWAIRNQTLAQFLNGHVKDPQLQNALASLWGYYGLPPSKLSAFYYANATGGYLRKGSFYIRSRSLDFSQTLAQTIVEHGGTMLYEIAAEKILMQNGTVSEVALSDGRILPARAVVSNAAAATTVRQMLPEGACPVDYLQKLESYKPSISSFIVWLGLKRELRGQIKGCGIHVASGLGAEDDYLSCLKGEVDRGSFSVSVYDNIYEGYSRKGSSTLMLLFLSGYEPWRRFESDYRQGRKDAYETEKQRWADILIRRAELQVIPGLSAMIEEREVASPLTNWHFTRNPEGAIYGYEQSMNNAFMNRIDNRTPVKGLYLASAWGNPGGGFVGALRSGEIAFERMMEDWG